ncbi:acyl-CoA dehydrogenase family protein [Streptomyces lincolnensis]|uniref:acyl-CoA dehydrogenase family protein n=2 Tax=Streptomyces TaxID=1883 RepID=UPI001E409851|nr:MULTISPECIES: acyl-CoA dehydrogenase family protein [Streptomyces]MCD7443072.1 acyl-CoA dehydrogenase family protein [Streptomyces lincolnensis]WLW51675.1 acyl-CoA dehydrogenase family protein [Streptomyces coralus]
MTIWNDEQRELRGTMRPVFDALGEDHLAWDRRGEFPREKWRTVMKSDLLRLPFAEEYGGLAQDLLTTMYVLEGLGEANRDGGLSFSVTTHMVSVGVPVQRFGSRDLKYRYLPGICDGTSIGAHAITEPDHGSDAMSMRTTAVRDGDDYILNGSKIFISNGPVADLFTVYVRTGTAPGPAALSAFLVERGTPGLTVGEPIEKMGLKTSPLAEVFLDDCRVPARNLVGAPGAGFLVLDHVMKWEILCSFAVNLGEMRHRLDRCVQYAGERRQFGQSIGRFQSVSHRIVEMKIATETAAKWLYDTAAKLLRHEDVTVDLAIAKILTSEGNTASALSALQIFGGYGYMTEYGIEKDVRNALAGTIYSGTSEIQRTRIAAMLGL